MENAGRTVNELIARQVEKKRHKGHLFEKTVESALSSLSSEYECQTLGPDGTGEKCCRRDVGDGRGGGLCITFWCPGNTVTSGCACEVEIGDEICSSCSVCGPSAANVGYDCGNIQSGLVNDVCSVPSVRPAANAPEWGAGQASETQPTYGPFSRTALIAICSGAGGLLLLALGCCCAWKKGCRRRASKEQVQRETVATAAASGSEDGGVAVHRNSSPSPLQRRYSSRYSSDAELDIESKAPTLTSEWQLSTLGDDGISTFAGDTIAPRMHVAFLQRHADDSDDHILPDNGTIATVDFDDCWKSCDGMEYKKQEPSQAGPSAQNTETANNRATAKEWALARQAEQQRSSDIQNALDRVENEEPKSGNRGAGLTDARPSKITGDAWRQTRTFPELEQQHSNKAHGKQRESTRERLFNVFVPPGKLGVIIDTRVGGGPPAVNAVFDSSVLAGMVEVGDRLVAVDDKDVSSMTAATVSKLIQLKSGNPRRKLTLVRSDV